MISGIGELRFSVKGRIVKRFRLTFLKKAPDNVILHIGTNDIPTSTPKNVSDKLLSLKSFIKQTLPQAENRISNLIKSNDNGKATLTVSKANEHLLA